MEIFTLTRASRTGGLKKIVKRTIVVRNKNTRRDEPLGPTKLRPDIIEALEQLSISKIARGVAHHTLTTSTQPIFSSTRNNAIQYALATTYIDAHFRDANQSRYSPPNQLPQGSQSLPPQVQAGPGNLNTPYNS